MNVMKNKRIKNGNIVLHGEVQGPAVATGTTVTSANSGAAAGNIVKLPCIPENTKYNLDKISDILYNLENIASIR